MKNPRKPPDAGKVLAAIAIIWALSIVLVGFMG
jgi:hypothetical protein